MNIKSATVYGLFGVFEHTVTFNPNGITFIHSCNGIGKTVFLKLIVYVLKGDIDKLTEMPFDRLDISFDNDTNLIIENDETPILIQMQKNELEEELTSEELQELKNDATYCKKWIEEHREVLDNVISAIHLIPKLRF